MPIGIYPRRPAVERFWSKVFKTLTCWLWTAGRFQKPGQQPYGAFAVNHQNRPAHRYAWELVGPPIPPGHGIYHICDVSLCVRNDDEGWYEVGGKLLPRRGHLFMGTQADNMADMVQKGRSLSGARSPRGIARLTVADVLEIRRLRNTGVSQVTLGSMFGVSPNHVSGIIHRRYWTHI